MVTKKSKVFTWLINVNGYGEFEFVGTEEEAEEMRRHKANWEQGVATKKIKDETKAAANRKMQ